MADTADDDRAKSRLGEERVTPIELILDLVFVLAFSRCTDYIIGRGTWLGFLDVVIALALLWRGWVGFSWFTAGLNPNSTSVRLALWTAMGAFLMMTVSLPRAFGELAYGFVGAYAVIRLVHVGLGLWASRSDERFRATVLRTGLGGAVAVPLLIAGSFINGLGGYILWITAVLADYVFAVKISRFDWPLMSGHFAERYGLIVIIALGESVLEIGAGARFTDFGVGTWARALAALAVVGLLWGTYFDGNDAAAEQRLVNCAQERQRNQMARRGYSFLHFPIVVGCLLLALGLEAAIAHPAPPFEGQTAVWFFGGLSMYLLAHCAFLYVMTGQLSVRRLVTGLLFAALVPVGKMIPAWQSLAAATAILAVFITAERLIRRKERLAQPSG